MKIKNEKLFIQIVCLFCSVGLWVIIMIQPEHIHEVNYTSIPVTIKNLSSLNNSNLVLMNPDKENFTVNVEVMGTTEQFTKINKSDFNAYIDIIGFTEGTQNAEVKITGPNGIEIKGVTPSRITCNIERVISKVMEVDVEYEGEHANNYYRANGTPNPSSVKITGPRSIVDSAQYAVATINVDGASSLVEKTVPVRVYNGTDTEIFMSSPVENVKVTVPIYPTKYVNLVPNIVGEPHDGYKLVDVAVKPNRVKIAARKDILDTIKELKVSELDITDSTKNILSSKEIINSKNVILLDLTIPPVVNVTIEEIIEKEIIVNINDIGINNLGDNYSMNILDENITITVRGASSVINKIVKNDIKLSIDLNDAVLGKNNIAIQTETEKELDNITLSKNTVEVELIEINDETLEQ